ncbi:hypothetical protein K1T73_08530 [Roseovarius sp. SCSIO 43702]|uniref:hypothetical protein n=1 Tax=Roseovarius sp. SCSIO 43702 TaxID=2823043 RepID=UPI001C72FAB6|nr:hypothetical protein [Roseovarius sp. SCSIO 43702]QYX58383.1 hypothetical protein K1T73_08530 [Roseovarius sp. SCSIO 43702]
MRTLLLMILLATAATSARAQSTPEGYFASGWPIALAEGACDGDEGCLTLLAECGPGPEDCTTGISLCSVDEAKPRPCLTDRQTVEGGHLVTVSPLGETPERLLFTETGTGEIAGRPARADGAHCLRDLATDALHCARPLVTPADLAPWAPAD